MIVIQNVLSMTIPAYLQSVYLCPSYPLCPLQTEILYKVIVDIHNSRVG